MKPIKESLSELFQSPVHKMSFPQYIASLNQSGKLTARSMMDIMTMCMIYIDGLEKKNKEYEANFKEIQDILGKLTAKMPKGLYIHPPVANGMEFRGIPKILEDVSVPPLPDVEAGAEITIPPVAEISMSEAALTRAADMGIDPVSLSNAEDRRKEQIKQKRIEAMAKAREAKKLKNAPPQN